MKKTQIERAAQDFLDYLATLNRSPATLKAYRQVLRYFAEFAEERFLAETTDQLNESLVEAWMKHLHERQIKANTRRTWLTVLKCWSKYLAHREYTTKDIAYAVAMPKAERRKPKWVPDERIRETLNYLLSNGHSRSDFWLNLRDHLVIRLLYVTGMRAGEIMSVDPSKDIRWDNHSIEVMGKGRKQRTVYADATTMELLKLFLEEQQKWIPNGHHLFHSEEGRPLCYATLQRTIQKHLGVSPHVLRHSYATNLRLRGMDLDALAELMGHESLETTRIYATLANEELRKRYSACGLLSVPAQPNQAQPLPVPPEIPMGLEIERVRRRLNGKRPR